jgi:hypothetical protein
MIPVGRVAKTYGGPDLMESGIREVNAISRHRARSFDHLVGEREYVIWNS